MTTYRIVNPATGEEVSAYPETTDQQVRDAVESADRAQRAWAATTSISQRAECIRRVAALHRERREHLASLIIEEMGKPLAQALDEVDFCTSIYDYFADNATTMLADEHIDQAGTDGSAVLRRAPVGVILGIMPWNYPYYQVSRFAAPNLIAGNTVLLKPAPQCPASSHALENIYRDAGFPTGAYTSLFATHDQIEIVIADPRVQGVSVTGSERAGAAVAALAGAHLKKVVLELGGSDPFLLLGTDDLDGVVASAVAARLENGGQACNAAKRFIVVDHLYQPFLDKLTDAMVAVKPGDPTSSDTALGPLSSTAAADRVSDQIDRALAQGATLVVGGDRDGNFITPAIVTGVKPSDDLFTEEVFGPVAVVYQVESEDAAVELANATPFGLGAYVFSTDPQQAARVADRMESGMVWLNHVGGDAPELPFGGVKRSGFGRELGRHGVDEFVNMKMIRTVSQEVAS